MKDVLTGGEVLSFSWLDTKDMMADVLTKQVKKSEDLEDVVLRNTSRLVERKDNMVVCVDGEIKLLNQKVKSDMERGE